MTRTRKPATKPTSRKATPAPTRATKRPTEPARGRRKPAASSAPATTTAPAPLPAVSALPTDAPPGAQLAIPIDTSRIIASRFNVPHRDPDPETVESVRELGNFQPILVRPIEMIGTRAIVAPDAAPDAAPVPAGVDFEIVLGECRWKACRITGRPVLAFVQRLTDEVAMTLQCEENLRRKDLTPMQEAAAFAHFLAQLGGDLDATARKVRKSLAYVAGRLKLAELPPAAQQALQAGEIRLGTALEIACLPVEADRVAALPLVIPHAGEEAITVREARDRITVRFHLRIVNAPFPLDDATLVPSAGTCTKCPKRTINQLALFGEGVKPDDRCSDRACWQAKTEAVWTRKAEAASAAGVAILDAQAEGKTGEKAKTTLYHPASVGLLDLDAECDVMIEHERSAAQARLEQAEAEKDKAAIDAAQAELDKLDNQDPPTWRDVLANAVPIAAIGRTENHAGRTTVHELVPERAAYLAITGTGVSIPPWMARKLAEPEPEPSSTPAQPAAELDAMKVGRRADSIRRLMITAAIATAGENAAPRPEPTFWRGLILATVYAVFSVDARVPGDLGDLEPMAKRRGWHTDDEQTMADVVIRETSRLSQQKLRGVLLEILCAALDLPDMAALGRSLGLDTGALYADAEEKARTELTAAAAKGKQRKEKKSAATSSPATQETTSTAPPSTEDDAPTGGDAGEAFEDWTDDE